MLFVKDSEVVAVAWLLVISTLGMRGWKKGTRHRFAIARQVINIYSFIIFICSVSSSDFYFWAVVASAINSPTLHGSLLSSYKEYLSPPPPKDPFLGNLLNTPFFSFPALWWFHGLQSFQSFACISPDERIGTLHSISFFLIITMMRRMMVGERRAFFFDFLKNIRFITSKGGSLKATWLKYIKAQPRKSKEWWAFREIYNVMMQKIFLGEAKRRNVF